MGHLSVVERLLQLPGINATANRQEALLLAVRHAHLSVVRRLLQAPGVDASLDENRLMIEAASQGNLGLVDLLLQTPGVDATARDQSALVEATSKGHLLVVDRLLQVPEINPTLHNHQSILVAAFRGHLNVVEALLTSPEAAVHYQVSSPQSRHVMAVRLTVPRVLQPSVLYRMLADSYRLAYVVSDVFPVGVSEVVCEMIVSSKGLVQWTLSVQRQLRILLRALKAASGKLMN
eukprot:TRINITY_DN2196_c0_g1_i1.p1 TRINITY_DN2196_c0_g1~~TRINITY_DN2196_c0_g1_i1.p1  ORF type:complete len:234 (+),score=10.35 TRINITY_DN2196_c0_g1_i1:340-1041(+)